MRSDARIKLLGREDVLAAVVRWRAAGEAIVFTNGVFDILHTGHLLSFEEAASFGDRLVVGVNSDASARSLGKGPGRPYNRDFDRATLIAGLNCVDAVSIFDEPTPRALIEAIRPDVLVKGADWPEERIEGREFAGRVERIVLKEGYSTTSLVEKIRASGKE
ncbi:MAG: adenylyltransferase/cytidyltransferase family protein [Calditrichaeota bacterium]|nr:adenylyltransferase/cytidyltransferase family protein [Calditrichota bacterium]